jgi:hypothetical protein
VLDGHRRRRDLWGRLRIAAAAAAREDRAAVDALGLPREIAAAGGDGCITTILPRSRPWYFASSASLVART